MIKIVENNISKSLVFLSPEERYIGHMSARMVNNPPYKEVVFEYNNIHGAASHIVRFFDKATRTMRYQEGVFFRYFFDYGFLFLPEKNEFRIQYLKHQHTIIHQYDKKGKFGKLIYRFSCFHHRQKLIENFCHLIDAAVFQRDDNYFSECLKQQPDNTISTTLFI